MGWIARCFDGLVGGCSIALVSMPVHYWNSSPFWIEATVPNTIVWVLAVSMIPTAALLTPPFGPSASPKKKKNKLPLTHAESQ
jgi:hypothetical protein